MGIPTRQRTPPNCTFLLIPTRQIFTCIVYFLTTGQRTDLGIYLTNIYLSHRPCSELGHVNYWVLHLNKALPQRLVLCTIDRREAPVDRKGHAFRIVFAHSDHLSGRVVVEYRH